ncbi:MAG: hypothetical protein AB9922_10545 [Bacteroidales bacterium]
MENNTKNKRVFRIILGILLAFAALNAFGGGYYGMNGAPGVPVEWLEGTPFSDYFYPGLILFVIVGGAFLTASILNFINHSFAIKATIGSVIIVFGWLTVQLLMIGYVSWMQPTTAVYSLFVLLIVSLLGYKKG